MAGSAAFSAAGFSIYSDNWAEMHCGARERSGQDFMVERFRVGVIKGTHGLRGEVNVFPTTDDMHRFRKLKKITLVTKKEERVLDISSVKFFKDTVILGFDGLDTIEQVQHLRGAELYVGREDAVPLEEGQYFIPDLIGLAVYEEEDGSQVGILEDVYRTGANDVYAVRTPEGKSLLLPVIPSCIRSVDPEGGKMTVHVLDGLRDL